MRIFRPIWEALNTNFPSGGGVPSREFALMSKEILYRGPKCEEGRDPLYLRKGGVPPEKILAGMADPGYPRDPPGPGTFSLKRG